MGQLPGFNGHKGAQTEGGIRTTAFVYAPQILPQGVVNNEMVTIKDIPLTILEIANVKHTENKSFEKMTGESVLTVLQGNNKKRERVHIEETMGKISVRKGSWKLVKIKSSLKENNWSLFNLANDLGESNNIANSHQGKHQELKIYWNDYKKENKVILPNWNSGY